MAATEQLSIEVRLRDFATKEFGKIRGAISGVTSTLASFKAAIVGSATAFAAYKAVEQAAKIESLSLAFENLTKQVGGSTDILDALRRGTRGTVTDLELMRNANNAILLGVAKSADEFEMLTTTARRLGRAVGIDTTTAFEKLTVAIGRQSDLRLDDLGIIISVEEANKEYAESVGKVAEELTKAEKGQAFLNAAMKATEPRLKSLGEDTKTLADEFGRTKAEILNTRDALLQALTPALTELFAAVANTLEKRRPEILEFFAQVVEAAGDVGVAVTDLTAVAEEAITRVKGFAEPFIDAFNLAEAGVKKVREAIESVTRGGVLPEDVARDLEEQERRIDALGSTSKRAGLAIAESTAKAAARLREMADAARSARDPLSEIAREQAKLRREFERWLEATSAGEEEWDALAASAEEMEEKIASWVVPLNAAGNAIERVNAEAAKLAEIHDIGAGLARGFEDLRVASTEWGIAATDAIHNVAGALTENLTDGIMSLIDGTKSFKEAFRDTTRSILSDIARIIVQTLILKAVQAGLGGLGGAIGFAKGGVAPGHLESVRGLASGDVIHPPGGLFRVGEGRKSEGVLPLARTSSGELGVQAVGGRGGMTQNVYLTVQYIGSVTAEKEMLQRNAETLAALTAQKMRTSASYREGMRAA